MFNPIILIFFVWVNCGFIYANKSTQDKIHSKKFVIVTASYNNINFVDKYLKSVFSQKCDENKFTFRVIYYDDASTDGTDKAAYAYKKKNNLGSKFCIIRNSKKVGAHENIYNAVHSCDNDEIVLIVDGDDCLARNDVLEILNRVYSDSDVWITYGQYKKYPGGKIGICHKIPEYVIKSNSFRQYKWVSSHLRTFYAWLYKRIKIEDLKFNGKFVPFGGDLAIMFPMLEMAGMHSRFIPEVLYEYNCTNSISYLNLIKDDKKDNKFNKRAESDSEKLKEMHAALKNYLRNELLPYLPLCKSDLLE